MYDEMIVNLDQQSYWHWVTEPIMMRMDGGSIFAEPELALADDSASDTGGTGSDRPPNPVRGSFRVRIIRRRV